MTARETLRITTCRRDSTNGDRVRIVWVGDPDEPDNEALDFEDQRALSLRSLCPTSTQEIPFMSGVIFVPNPDERIPHDPLQPSPQSRARGPGLAGAGGAVKKKARPSESRFHVVCPFCEALVDKVTALRWCSGCFNEWYENRNGDIVFDDKRRTPRFAWAKAIQKAGGLGIGPAA